jgi:hypothetical protein
MATQPTPVEVLLKQTNLSTAQVMRELGRTGLIEYSGEIHEQPLRKLQGSRARKVWTEMYRYDPMVGMAIRAIQLLTRGVIWRVEPAVEDEAQAMDDAEYLESVMIDMSHSWRDFMSNVVTMLPYGFAPFEIVLKQRQGEKETPGESSRYTDGLYGVRKLAIRAQDTVDRWVFDDEGGIAAMVQCAPPDYTGIEIPIEKLLLFRADPARTRTRAARKAAAY